MAIDKKPRSASTRDKVARTKHWQQPSSLDTPTPPEGFKFRWIRESVRGFDDTKNIMGKLREGWELVRADEYPDWQLPSIDDGKHAGVIGVGGLLLARMPVETVEERNSYYKNLTESQKEAVDSDLLKIEDPRMPISKPQRQTKVTFGSGNKS